MPYLGIFGLVFEKILSYLKLAFLDLSCCKVWCKNKNLMPNLGILGTKFEKNYCHIWNQDSQIHLVAKFCKKTKMLKFGTKNALFGYFWAMVKKTIVIFEISTLELSKISL